MPSLPTIPPRCLQKFRTKVVSNAQAGLAADFVDFTSFALACHCGNDVWHVMGNWFENTKEFVGPLIAVCSRCAKHQRLIDRAIDGYNAEIGDPFPDEDEANDMWFCIRCNNKEGRLIASFGYQYDLDTTEPRLQDYFDCFLLTHTCLTSASTIQVAMQDCA